MCGNTHIYGHLLGMRIRLARAKHTDGSYSSSPPFTHARRRESRARPGTHAKLCNLTIPLAAAQEYYRYMYMLLLFTGLHELCAMCR